MHVPNIESINLNRIRRPINNNYLQSNALAKKNTPIIPITKPI